MRSTAGSSFAQTLYAFGAFLCVFNTYWSIGFIVLVQLNFAIAPKIPRPRLGRRSDPILNVVAAGSVHPGERAHVRTPERDFRRVRQVELPAQDRGTAIDDRDGHVVRTVLEVHDRAAR